MLSIQTEIQTQLFAHQDLGYRDFQAKLMPTIQKSTIIGVRTPILRTLAKTFYKHSDIAAFLSILPNTYYEENNLHGLLLAQMKDFTACLQAVKRFLPYIDNWATCDLLSPPVFQSHTDELLPSIQQWLQASHCYTVRFGIGMLRRHHLDDYFQPVYLQCILQRHLQNNRQQRCLSWKTGSFLLGFTKRQYKKPAKAAAFRQNKKPIFKQFYKINIHAETALDTFLCHSAVLLFLYTARYCKIYDFAIEPIIKMRNRWIKSIRPISLSSTLCNYFSFLF